MPISADIPLHGGDVWQGDGPQAWLDFSANLRPEGMPAWVRGVLSSGMEDAQYYPDVQQRQATEGLARYLGVPVDAVLPFSGGIAAIDMVCRTAAGRVLADPVSFGEYARRAAAYGREVCAPSPASPPQEGDTLFLCNPNNPTGAATGRAEVFNLHRRLQAARGRLCVDEAFIDFCPRYSVRREAALRPGLIVVGSLTKILCVPGIRLGYMVAAPDAIRAMRRLCPPWSLNSCAAALARALPLHAQEIRQDAGRNAARRAHLAHGLAALNARVTPSEANFLLADFGIPMDGALEELKRRGILARHCGSFGLPSSFVRFAVKTEEQNDALLAALKEALCAAKAL